MNRIKQFTAMFIYGVCFLCLIIDAKTVVFCCRNSLELCFYTVIPSLFPFITLSILLNNSLSGLRLRILRPIGRLLNIPEGAESILLLGFLGGYPVGAQAISESYRRKTLSPNAAFRMLGFCSNAGPSFIFGMISGLFTNTACAWYLWLIHILSGCLVGIILPRLPCGSYSGEMIAKASVSMALEKSLKVTGIICGWVILFRILIGFMDIWLFPAMPSSLTLAIQGLMELTNGCIISRQISSEGLRFIYLSTILGFGGLCVFGQTAAVTKGIGLGYYFPGKILQACFSMLLSILVQPIIFPKETQAPINYPAAITTVLISILIGIWFVKKKTVAFSSNSMYNEEKITL